MAETKTTKKVAAEKTTTAKKATTTTKTTKTTKTANMLFINFPILLSGTIIAKIDVNIVIVLMLIIQVFIVK